MDQDDTSLPDSPLEVFPPDLHQLGEPEEPPEITTTDFAIVAKLEIQEEQDKQPALEPEEENFMQLLYLVRFGPPASLLKNPGAEVIVYQHPTVLLLEAMIWTIRNISLWSIQFYTYRYKAMLFWFQPQTFGQPLPNLIHSGVDLLMNLCQHILVLFWDALRSTMLNPSVFSWPSKFYTYWNTPMSTWLQPQSFCHSYSKLIFPGAILFNLFVSTPQFYSGKLGAGPPAASLNPWSIQFYIYRYKAMLFWFQPQTIGQPLPNLMYSGVDLLLILCQHLLVLLWDALRWTMLVEISSARLSSIEMGRTISC